MSKIIGAPTLDDALTVLQEWVKEGETRGEKNFIFCEDRLTLLSERAVLEALGGTLFTEVSTFARFLSGSASVLSKQGSVMQISAILAEKEGELSCFSKNSAQTVYETIAQFSASRVTVEMLNESATETDGILQKKLLDLALVQEAYEAFLRERNLVDEGGYLSLLPQKIPEKLTGVRVCFFAFPSFTRQAQEGVRAALECAGEVTGIFVAGRADLYTNEGARVFRRVCEEYGDTQSVLKKTTLSGDALVLRDGLFSPESYSRTPVQTERVHLFEAADSEEELNAVAACIKRAIAQGLRYRDIAVLVGGEEKFSTVEKVFSAYRIPFFADKKRAFSEHPFCAFLLSILDGVQDGVLPEEADTIASSAYFGEGDEYRNYLLKFGGYRGAVKREIKEGEAVKNYRREGLVTCRERMLALLSLFPKKGKIAKYTAAIRALYEFVEGERVCERLKENVSASEGEFLVVDPLWKILDEMDALSDERTFTAREFSAMIESGLEACSVSLIPQYSDAVFVGDMTESRLARVKLLFATGLTDELPRCTADSAVISDGEIKRLSALQVEIEPAIAQVNARAREGLALNLCAFSDELYLSYPLREKGEECACSEVISYVKKLFEMQPMQSLFPFDCCEREPALKKLLSLRNQFEGGRTLSRKEYDGLYAALCATDEAERCERLLGGREKSALSCGEALYFAGGSVSPTLLEQYFACPYRGFIARGLRLREREEKSVLDTDAGTFVHAVLERVAGKLNEITSEEECRKIARAEADNLTNTPRFSALFDTRAGEYASARLVEESATVCAVAYRQLTQSSFRVRDLESKVRLPELQLLGTADRVDESDEFVRVIDYKTGGIDDKPVSYYTGKKLQLQLYLKGSANGKIPAGAFYFPASDPFTKEEENKYKMLGFYNADEASVTRLDGTLSEGDKSSLFDGGWGGRATDRGMSGEDFVRFLDYATLVSARAEGEMKAGNIAPSPYEGTCGYCKLKGLCGFDGSPRKEGSVKSGDIVKIVRRETGEEVE